MGWRRRDICKPPSVPGTAFADLAQIMFFILPLTKNVICAKLANAVHGMEVGLHTLCLLQPILDALQPKITAKNSDLVRLTRVQPDGSNSKTLTWREYFASELNASGA